MDKSEQTPETAIDEMIGARLVARAFTDRPVEIHWIDRATGLVEAIRTVEFTSADEPLTPSERVRLS